MGVTKMLDIEGPVSLQREELPELIALLNRVFRPSGGDMRANYPRHVGANNLDNLRVIKEGGRIVSHVGVSIRGVLLAGVATRVAGVGAVATDEQARGKGYASQLMEDAIRRSRAAGADIMLISGDDGVYKRLHAVECGRFKSLTLTRKQIDKQTGNHYSVTVAEASEEDIDAIIALRRQASTRYLLPYEDMQAVFRTRWVMDNPATLWLARSDGEAVGFAATWKRDAGQLRLLDWAGSTHALSIALGELLKATETETLRWNCPASESLPLGWNRYVDAVVPFPGTVLVIDAERLLSRAREWFIERVGEEVLAALRIEADAQSARFTLGAETAIFENGGELAQLLFGMTKIDPLEGNAKRIGELRAVLERMFPLPLVGYGLAYV